MFDLAGWIAPAATMIAAVMTAANLGARVTGWGFVVFSIGAVAWVMVAVGSGQQNLLWSNAFLLLVDVIGIWRWLGRRARYDAGAEAAARRSAAVTAPTLFALTQREGLSVESRDGTALGTAVDAMATCSGGAISYLVVRAGGIGGVGETLRALGWDEVEVHDGRLVSRLDPAALARRPVLEAGKWPATAAAAGVG